MGNPSYPTDSRTRSSTGPSLIFRYNVGIFRRDIRTVWVFVEVYFLAFLSLFFGGGI